MFASNLQSAVLLILYELQFKDGEEKEAVDVVEIQRRLNKLEKGLEGRVPAALEHWVKSRLVKRENERYALTGAGQVYAMTLEWPDWLKHKLRQSTPNPSGEKIF